MAATTRAALGAVRAVRAVRTVVLLGATLAATLASREARALDPLKTPSQYVQHLWQQSEHGLPQNYVAAVVQTRDGYLWLTTQEGLARFDGVRFVVFSTTTVPQLGTNDLDALCEDRGGALWIGALGGGLVRYADGKFTAFKRADGLVNDNVLAIHEARDGALWVGTRGGVSKLQGGHFTSFTTAQGLANDTVSAIAEQPDGTLWFGTDGGVSRFAGGSFTTVKEGLSDPSVAALAADSDGALWIGSVGGLDRLQGGALQALRTFGAVHSLLRDRHGNLWIGAEGGLARLSSGASAEGKATPLGVLTLLEGTDAHPFDAASLIEDREGNLWAGLEVNGLLELQDGKVTTFGTSYIWSTFLDANGKLWLGGAPGLFALEGDRVVEAPGVGSYDVEGFAQNGADGLWLRTSSAGLLGYRNGTVERASMVGDIGAGALSSPYADSHGSLWMETRDGIARVENGKVTRYGPKDGVPDTSIRVFSEAPDGTLWIASEAGLLRFEDGHFTRLTVKDGLSNDSVLALYPDGDDLWVGTSGGGLDLLRGKKLAGRVTTKNGLFNDLVFTILDDQRGSLWMTCNRGIFRAKKSDLIDVATGVRPTLESPFLGTSDGMRSAECNNGTPGGVRTPDGKLWFPTAAGAVRVDPAHMPRNAVVPPVVVEEMRVDRALVDKPTLRGLPAGSRDFEIIYTALSLTAPKRVRFKYKLEGFDKEWIDAGGRRAAYYTNLAPGPYRFRVIACNDDGVWNEDGDSIAFVLLPHFYQTVPFYFACALAVLLVGAGTLRLRVRALREKARELEAKVEERTREIAKASSELRVTYRALADKDERQHADLLQAKAFQERILPKLPRGGAVRFRAVYRPADLVGGDVYDVCQLAEGHYRVFVADLTGHGVQASLRTMVLKTEYDRVKLAPEGPARVLAELNRKLATVYPDLAMRCSACCFDVIADGDGVALRYSNAAHLPLLRVSEGVVTEIYDRATFLGVQTEAPFTQQEVKLGPQDRVVAYTDGICEQEDESGHAFGMDRMQELLGKAPGDADRIVHDLDAALTAFAGGGPLDDDVVILCVECGGDRRSTISVVDADEQAP